MSASHNVQSEFNFRKIDKRLVTVKTKSPSLCKVAVQDMITNLMFAIEIPKETNMDSLEVNHEYLFNIKIETAKKTDDIDGEFTNFFEAIDVEQSTEDFIRAYWLLPTKIRFELLEAEEP